MMNEDELKGGVRYTVGKVEKTIGDTVESRDWQVEGIVDQVSGGIQHGYGRARSVAEDALDSAPELAEAAREQLKVAADRVAAATQHGGRVAAQTVREAPLLWGVAAAMGGYALAWLVHGRHDR